MTKNIEIVYLPVTELAPYERNARKHQDKDVEAIVASIQEFGFDDPIGIWSEKNIIVEGHGRLLAAQKLGMTEVPCIRLDHLTDEQRRAYALAHNRTAELSEWDFVVRDDELQGITEIDMTAFGFDLADDDPEEAVEDDFEGALPEEPKTKLGDIYQLGKHRLICGDSTDQATLEKLLNGTKADLLLTDPPYGIDYGAKLKGKGDGKGGSDRFGWKSWDAPEWDKHRPEIGGLLSLADNAIVWGGNYFTGQLPVRMCWLVWDKGQRDFSLADGELAWTSFDKALRIKSYSRASANREEKFHPTQKPIELLRWCVQDIAERYAGKIETVVDPFGGSGSTLITCEQLKKVCFMCELDPKYCDVIVERWESLTGKKAELLDGGST